MKILYTLLTIFLGSMSASVFSGCDVPSFLRNQITGSGVMKVEKRSLANFKGVDISGALKAKIVVQQAFNVEVEADDNIVGLIKTEIKDGILCVYQSDEYSFNNTTIVIRIALPELVTLDVSGASSASVEHVRSQRLAVDLSGASSITVNGSADDLVTDVSGASTLTADGLQAARVNIDVSGASEGSVFATERLQAQASGASTIHYKGDPKTIEEETSGASSIRRR